MSSSANKEPNNEATKTTAPSLPKSVDKTTPSPAKESRGRILKKAIKEVSQKTPLSKTVDPLNDTLDNLIRKQKIAKLQGMANAPLGVQTKSGKFKQPNTDTTERAPSKSTFFKNMTLLNTTNDNSQNNEVIKVPKICINFPNCQYGDKCRYIHPVHKICKNLPNCPFGDKCAFIHPSNG